MDEFRLDESMTRPNALPVGLLAFALAALVVSAGGAVAHEGHGTTDTPDDPTASPDAPDPVETNWPAALAGLFALVALPVAPAYWVSRDRPAARRVTRLHGVALALALFTAAVHLYLFLDHGRVVMLFAALGFLCGIGLHLRGANRRALYAAGIPYTLVQIALWIGAGMPHLASFGLLDKLAQVALVAVLGYLYWTGRR